jgi:exodeoxyribonuclease-3
MRIMTWNINSVRLRINQVLHVANECKPDIICLQETKTPDDKFPIRAFEDAGYHHTHIHGMKSYNGVAILAKTPFVTNEIHHRLGKEDCRHIAVQFELQGVGQPVSLHCMYIPAGGDEPDPDTNDKYAHKLAFVDEMTNWFSDNCHPDAPVITLGDFNIAPLENDVWSHKQLLNVISHTPAETSRLQKMQDSLNFTDAIRYFVPPEEKCYTWWSYRNRDWKKSNRGRRLDHIWLTQPLAEQLQDYEIIYDARDWEKPSDHAPVLVDLEGHIA